MLSNYNNGVAGVLSLLVRSESEYDIKVTKRIVLKSKK